MILEVSDFFQTKLGLFVRSDTDIFAIVKTKDSLHFALLDDVTLEQCLVDSKEEATQRIEELTNANIEFPPGVERKIFMQNVTVFKSSENVRTRTFLRTYEALRNHVARTFNLPASTRVRLNPHRTNDGQLLVKLNAVHNGQVVKHLVDISKL